MIKLLFQQKKQCKRSCIYYVSSVDYCSYCDIPIPPLPNQSHHTCQQFFLYKLIYLLVGRYLFFFFYPLPKILTKYVNLLSRSLLLHVAFKILIAINFVISCAFCLMRYDHMNIFRENSTYFYTSLIALSSLILLPRYYIIYLIIAKQSELILQPTLQCPIFLAYNSKCMQQNHKNTYIS